jgi:hypothetical protein
LVLPGRLLKKRQRREARANLRNLKGFLDAFKAVLMSQAGQHRPLRHPLPPSLTHCEDFA